LTAPDTAGEKLIPYINVKKRIPLRISCLPVQHWENKRRVGQVKLSQYQAMCISLVQQYQVLRRLRAAVREAEADAASSPAKLAEKMRKKRAAARLKAGTERQRAARRPRR
jgi:hypothetical protein